MTEKPIPQRLDPHLIRMDLNTHARKGIGTDCVTEYAEAMERGVTFPPLTVFFNVAEQQYILADGFFRLLAHLKAKPNDLISVDQYLGTVEDAQWFAICANQLHGLKRSNEDKRNAIKLALLHSKGESMSDRGVGEKVGVDHKTVAVVRRELEATGEIPQSSSRTGRDGRTINTANIGKTVDCCNDCGNYKRGGCLLDGEDYPPTNPACEEFEVPLEVIDDRGRAVYYESDDDPSERKEVQHRVSRRHKGEYVRVPLDKTNTDRAALEIRLFLGENYLASLAQSAIKILKED